MDKYTVKMFPQAYRDLDKIYEHALANSNYNNNALIGTKTRSCYS